MEDNQNRLIDVAKDLLLDLKEESVLMQERLVIMNLTTANDFIPLNPTNDFSLNAGLVENERALSILQVKTHLDKLQGQIEGQEELIYKLSKEGQEEEKERLEMIRENSDMKGQISILEEQVKAAEAKLEEVLKLHQTIENGEE